MERIMNIFKTVWMSFTDPERLAYEQDRPGILESIRKLEASYYRKPFIKVQAIEDKIVQLKKDWNV